MRYAIVSDIHGNLPALQAVVDDFARRGVDTVINLGDSLSGPLLPLETAQYLMAQPGWTHLTGNHERQILSPGTPVHTPVDALARAALGKAELDWIAAQQPAAWYQPGLYLCHGTPTRDTHYLLETVEPSHVRLATAAEIRQRLGDIDADLVLCGHTHRPRMVRLPDGPLIVNPGSVGLPAFDDRQFFPHVIETGAPDARYALVEYRAGRWQAELIAVPYDHLPMVKRAEAARMPDWALALATGRAVMPS